jgi:2-methylcitrate dehydratase
MNMNASISVPAVNAIAAFANRASVRALKPDIRKLFKRNILDSLGCAIAALPGVPFAALRDDGRLRAARWRFDELHVGIPSMGE